MTFLSAAVGAAIVAWRSSLPFAIAGPDSSISVVLAALVATLANYLLAHGGTRPLGPALIALSLTTAVTGAVLWVLGFARAGRAIRFVPYPVIGGFLGATGWLMVTGAVQVITDQKVTLDNLGAFTSGPVAAKIAAGVVVALVLHVRDPIQAKRLRSPRRARRRDRHYAPCFAVDRLIARAGAGRRLALSAAAGRTSDPAVEA